MALYLQHGQPYGDAKMQITKESLNKGIERLDKKITVEMEQMKHDAEWILDRIGDPEAVVNYGFTNQFPWSG